MIASEVEHSARIVQLAGTAVSLGTELYNRGDVNECFLLYRKTAMLLLGEVDGAPEDKRISREPKIR